MLRRKIAALLAAAAIINAAIGAVGAANYSPWFSGEYLEMRDHLGIVPGSFDSMDLTQLISRDEICQLAVPAFEKLSGNHVTPEKQDYFSDTADGNIIKAYELGIVSGYTDGTFQPKKGLTRQEFFKILVNFCNAAGYAPKAQGSLSTFTDGSGVAAWAADAALICISHGYVRGDANRRLNPHSSITRQEAMAMFARCYKGLEQYYLNVVTAPFIITASGSLNIRSGPSIDHDKLGSLPSGSVINANSMGSSGWYRFLYNGSVGYLKSDYLAPTTMAASSGAASSETAQKIINLALTFLGTKYVYGGKSPSTGFDCSGLVYYVFGQHGIKMNRVADDQMDQGIPVDAASLVPGDLLFWGYGSYANHVGIYIGDGNFVHASNPSSGIRISSMSETYYAKRYLGARRVLS